MEDKVKFNPEEYFCKLLCSAVQCHNSEDHSNNELLHFLSPLLNFDEI